MKNVFKHLGVLALTVVMSLSSAIPALAAGNDVQTGGVNVTATTYTLDSSNKKVEATDSAFKDLMPGEIVNYIITVDNNAMSAYVRVKIVSDVFKPEMLTGVSDDWVYTNNYYYYKKALDSKQSVDLCKYLKIPSDITKSFSLKVVAEGIQSANFTPDWSNKDPWGGVTVESNVAVGTMYTDERGYAVTTDDNLKGCPDKNIVLTTKNNLLPGDTVKDTLVVKPKVDGKITFQLKDAKAPEQADMYQLVLSVDGKEIYKGTLFDDKLTKGIELIDAKKDKEIKIEYTLTLDTKMTNKAEWTEPKATFYLSQTPVKPEPTPTPEPDKGDPDRVVKTGDNGTMVLMFVLAASALLIGGGLVGYKVLNKKEGANSDDK